MKTISKEKSRFFFSFKAFFLNISNKKMKNYTSFNSSIQEKDLFSYYCALCGALVLVTNSSLEKMPLRSADNAIVIHRKEVFCKLYLKKSGTAYIQRQNGLEPQFRWRCECGVLIGYQAITFEESDLLSELWKKSGIEEVKLNCLKEESESDTTGAVA